MKEKPKTALERMARKPQTATAICQAYKKTANLGWKKYTNVKYSIAWVRKQRELQALNQD